MTKVKEIYEDFCVRRSLNQPYMVDREAETMPTESEVYFLNEDKHFSL